MELLWHWAKRGNSPTSNLPLQNYRCLMLPKDPKKAAQFIFWSLQQKIFLTMMHKKEESETDPELNVHGVDEFWKKVTDYVLSISPASDLLRL